MKINTHTVWDMTGDELVEIHNESYEYEGPVSEAKGGGSCPPPDNTAQYGYAPQTGAGEANMMGGIGALGAMANNTQTANQAGAPPPGAYGTAPGRPTGGGAPIGGVQYTNPMELMQDQQLMAQYDLASRNRPA